MASVLVNTVNSTVNKVIAQGEDFPIFFRVYPSQTDKRLDRVWFETDEGYTTDFISEPPYSATLQLIFSAELTSKFTVGDHHVRLWGIDNGVKYVLTELTISVNPAFPFTSETLNKDYVYESNVSNTNFVDSSKSSVKVSTYNGKVSSPAQWNHNTYEVNSVDELPDYASIGDTALVKEMEPYLYWICVGEEPAIWKRLTAVVFVGSTEGLVPESTEETQNKYLKGNGEWSIIDSSSVDTSDFLMTTDNVYINCQPFEIEE